MCTITIHSRVDQLLFLEVSSILADPWPDEFSRCVTFLFSWKWMRILFLYIYRIYGNTDK